MAVNYNRSPAASVPAINNELEKIEVALQDAVSRTGVGPNQLEATVDANSQRIINLPKPENNSEPARYGDVEGIVSGFIDYSKLPKDAQFVDSLINLLSIDTDVVTTIVTNGFYPNTTIGGGHWKVVKDADLTKNNGGTFVSKSALQAWHDAALSAGGVNTTNLQANLNVLFTAGTGTGDAFVRIHSIPLAKPSINTNWFGVIGDDVADESDAVNKALNVGAGADVFISKQKLGSIRAHFLSVKANTRVDIQQGTVIKSPLSLIGQDTNSRFVIISGQNIEVNGNGSTFLMENPDYTGSFAHGILIDGNANNVKIKGLTIDSAKGDGIYIGSSVVGENVENVYVEGCTAIRSYRNNITIAGAKTVHLHKCYMQDANGTNPQFGLDIEPNTGFVNDDILVTNCVASGNAGSGFGAPGNNTNITFKWCVSMNNVESGFYVPELANGTPSDITLFGCKSINNGNVGFYLYQSDGVNVNFCESIGDGGFGVQLFENDGISINTLKIKDAGSRGLLIQNPVSGATITNARIYDSGDAGVYLQGSNITLKDCYVEGSAKNASPTYDANIYIFGGTDIEIVNCKARIGNNANKPAYGLQLRATTSIVDLFLANNNFKTSGEVSGFQLIGGATFINAGNINNDGTYSTTAN